MKVNNVLAVKSPDVITIGLTQPIREAVALLAQHNIGALIVIEADGSLAGMITERDIIRCIAEHEHFLSLTVEQVIKRDVITGKPEQDLKPVARTMQQNNIRYLPIVEDGKPAGIITLRDILRFQRNQHRGEVDTLTDRLMAEKA